MIKVINCQNILFLSGVEIERNKDKFTIIHRIQHLHYKHKFHHFPIFWFHILLDFFLNLFQASKFSNLKHCRVNILFKLLFEVIFQRYILRKCCNWYFSIDGAKSSGTRNYNNYNCETSVIEQCGTNFQINLIIKNNFKKVNRMKSEMKIQSKENRICDCLKLKKYIMFQWL